jgi:hypothetical protein
MPCPVLRWGMALVSPRSPALARSRCLSVSMSGWGDQARGAGAGEVGRRPRPGQGGR